MVHFQEFEAKTGGRLDALDVTAEVAAVVRSSGIESGTALVFSPHTTACVMIAAPGPHLSELLAREMELVAPAAAYNAHDDLAVRTENLVEDELPNAPAHLFHVFAGKASECIPIAEGALALSSGQRVLLVELDRSRLRRYCVQVVGEQR
jgi:secondary thiamine-phosphate synthase enzyme